MPLAVPWPLWESTFSVCSEQKSQKTVQGSGLWPWVACTQSPAGSGHPRAAVSLHVLARPEHRGGGNTCPDPIPEQSDTQGQRPASTGAFCLQHRRALTVFPSLRSRFLRCPLGLSRLEGCEGRGFQTVGHLGSLGVSGVGKSGLPASLPAQASGGS